MYISISIYLSLSLSIYIYIYIYIAPHTGVQGTGTKRASCLGEGAWSRIFTAILYPMYLSVGRVLFAALVLYGHGRIFFDVPEGPPAQIHLNSTQFYSIPLKPSFAGRSSSLGCTWSFNNPCFPSHGYAADIRNCSNTSPLRAVRRPSVACTVGPRSAACMNREATTHTR